MKSLPEIKAEIDCRASLIGAAGHHSLPTYGHSDDSGRPHIEVNWMGYHYVVAEQGKEDRVTTVDLDNLLYHVFDTITFDLAHEFELMHRNESQDFRRLLFQHQETLLSKISTQWAQRKGREHARILSEHPFDDAQFARAALSKQLYDQGIPDAWAKACERFPKPAN